MAKKSILIIAALLIVMSAAAQLRTGVRNLLNLITSVPLERFIRRLSL